MIDPDFISNDKGKPGVTRGRKTMDPCGTARLPFCCTDVCCAKAEPPPVPGRAAFPIARRHGFVAITGQPGPKGRNNEKAIPHRIRGNR